MSVLEEYTDAEVEEMASIHVDKIRLLIQSYSVVHAEGVNRRIESFLDSQVTLMRDDQRSPVASHVKTLDAQALVEHVYRYKSMSTCLKITLDEIKRRLLAGEGNDKNESSVG